MKRWFDCRGCKGRCKASFATGAIPNKGEAELGEERKNRKQSRGVIVKGYNENKLLA